MCIRDRSLDAPNGELRGKDEWERVSWDEALDLVAQGLTRAKEQYGNRSIPVSYTHLDVYKRQARSR